MTLPLLHQEMESNCPALECGGLVTALTNNDHGKWHHVTSEGGSEQAYGVHLGLLGHVLWGRLTRNTGKPLAVADRACTWAE